jgi:hypothetical protein
MKNGLRFVDCDMHVMEPPDLFETYLEPKFKDRVILPVGADGRSKRGMIVIDGVPSSRDAEMQQHRKPNRTVSAVNSTQPLSGSRIAEEGHLDFAIERGYNAEAQIMGMELEGIDIAVLFPTVGLSLIARDKNVSNNLLSNVSRETAAQILMGGAHLYGFGDDDFEQADAAAAEHGAAATPVGD